MLTEKQQQLWNFLSEYIDTCGTFPKFKDIAEKFDISIAAASHNLDALANKNRLAKNSKLGYLLINENGTLHTGAGDEHTPGDYQLELSLALPENYRKTDEENLVFKLKSDLLNQCSIRNGDLLEMTFTTPGTLKSGDLVVIRRGMSFFIRLHLPPQLGRLKTIGISQNLLYDKQEYSKFAIGKITRVYRTIQFPFY